MIVAGCENAEDPKDWSDNSSDSDNDSSDDEANAQPDQAEPSHAHSHPLATRILQLRIRT